MTARCMRCKRATGDVGSAVRIAKNGARMNHSTCSVCGTKKCQIVPGGSTRGKPSVRVGGSAFTDFFTKTIPRAVLPALKKPSTYLKLGAMIPGPVGMASGAAGTIAGWTGNGVRGGSTYYSDGQLKTGINPSIVFPQKPLFKFKGRRV